MYRKNISGQFVCFQLILAASGTKGTGLTVAVRRCLDGTFGDGEGTVTEDGTTGGYKYAMAQADTNANNISLFFAATGVIPVCISFLTTAVDPTAAALGITDIASIKTQTDKLAFTVTNKVDANILDIGGDATSPTNLAKATNAIPRGTVTTGAGTTSVTTSALSIAGSAATGVVADQFKGRVVLFDGATTTAGLRGASSAITASTASNTPTLTVDPALPATPASGDLFSVI